MPVRRELFGSPPATPSLGELMPIKQFSCNVIGVLASRGQTGLGDQDDSVVVPLHTLQRRVTGSRRFSTLIVKMREGSDGADPWPP